MLYVELKDYASKLLICNLFRNSLLREVPANDAKDAAELCRLLRAGMLKEVYHCNNENYTIRKIVSSYEDLVNALVREKNQLSAVYRSYGKKNYKKERLEIEDANENLIG